MVTKKPRSPNYPQIPLREAIERVNKIYRANRNHRAEKEAVAKALNYGGLNGASVSLIGTLKQYGLLEEDKEGVKVTEDAITILRAPESDPERVQALRRAAFLPKIFAELREAYGEDLSELPVETTLQFRLEKRGFLEKAAGEVIRTYRDNLEFASEEDAEYVGAEGTFVEPLVENHGEQAQQTANIPKFPTAVSPNVSTPASSVEQDSLKEYLHVFAKGCEMRLLIDGVPTQEAIDRLIGYLSLGKEDLPSSRDSDLVAEQPNLETPDSN